MLLVFIAFSVFFTQCSAEDYSEEIKTEDDEMSEKLAWFKEYKSEDFQA